MVSRDDAADGDGDSHDLVMKLLMLSGKWYVLCSSPLPINTSLARREC
jgi:hypothetical protein